MNNILKNKKLIIFIVISTALAIVVMVFIFNLLPYKKVSNVIETPYFTGPAKEYSAQGDVVEINGRSIVLRVQVLAIGGGGNYYNQQDKEVVLASDARMETAKIVGGKIIKEKASLEDIVVGSTIVVYSTENIVDVESLSVSRADILLF